MRRRLRAPHGGFTYLGVLFLVAAVGLALVAVAQVWSTTAKREREEELLFVGAQFRGAIEAYRTANANVGDGFPKELDWLLKDPHHPAIRRHLRRIYVDPITGSTEWGLVKTPAGGITGVHSLSEDAPIKTGAFPPEVTVAEGGKKYSDWIFAVSTSAMAPPGGQQGPSGTQQEPLGAQPPGTNTPQPQTSPQPDSMGAPGQAPLTPLNAPVPPGPTR
jgi:type II secretory pathway pseudopilin PulG